MMKVQISIDEELLAKIDEMAKALYTNRSAYISMTMAQMLKIQQDSMGMMENVAQKTIENSNKEGGKLGTKL